MSKGFRGGLSYLDNGIVAYQKQTCVYRGHRGTQS